MLTSNFHLIHFRGKLYISSNPVHIVIGIWYGVWLSVLVGYDIHMYHGIRVAKFLYQTELRLVPCQLLLGPYDRFAIKIYYFFWLKLFQ